MSLLALPWLQSRDQSPPDSVGNFLKPQLGSIIFDIALQKIDFGHYFQGPKINLQMQELYKNYVIFFVVYKLQKKTINTKNEKPNTLYNWFLISNRSLERLCLISVSPLIHHCFFTNKNMTKTHLFLADPLSPGRRHLQVKCGWETRRFVCSYWDFSKKSFSLGF